MTELMAPALTLRSVGAGYGGRQVVRQVSVTVPAGCWLAIIGPNGAGKSTLLKAIVGLADRTGEVLLGDRDTTTMTHRERARQFGYAAQNPVLPNDLTVIDYVLLGRTPHLRPLARESAGDLAVVSDALARLDLTELAGRRLTMLSGGERRRVVLARTLAQQAGLLLLDEPTTGLDIGHAQQLLDLIDTLRRTERTTVISTLHDLTLAGQYADHLLLLAGGHVVATGPPTEVLTTQRISQHYAATVEVLHATNNDLVVTPVRAQFSSSLAAASPTDDTDAIDSV